MIHLSGHCPACGREDLVVISDAATPQVHCNSGICPDNFAASRVLQDDQIHHVVRFDDEGRFSVKHPLRERINSELLDCTVHHVVIEQVNDGLIIPQGTYELRPIPFIASPNGGVPQEADWEWEAL